MSRRAMSRSISVRERTGVSESGGVDRPAEAGTVGASEDPGWAVWNRTVRSGGCTPILVPRRDYQSRPTVIEVADPDAPQE